MHLILQKSNIYGTANLRRCHPPFAVGGGHLLARRLDSSGSMHYEREALLIGVYRGDVGQESEEKIGKLAEEWHCTLRERLR
jgi:hypothetical protein